MGKLGEALRKKFKTPREALRALGLDEKLLDSAQIAFDGANKMKPTRLEYAVLMRTAAAINPLLAMDAKGVNYAPIFKGLTTKNFAQRKTSIVSGVQKAIKGKTIAKDASIEHLAKMLDTFEHEPSAEKSWDESVSEPQHKAMEAAAQGKSNLEIPKSVGKEFSDADKGKTFGDMIKDWAVGKDWSAGMSDDDIAELDKMHTDALPPEFEKEKEDEDEDADDGVIEKGAEEADDNAVEEEPEGEKSKEDKDEEKRDAEDRKGAKDRKAAKDRKNAKDRKGAMDRTITQDDMNKAIAAAVRTTEQKSRSAAEARAFVRPFVGELPIALDSAEGILRSAARAMQIEDASTVDASALKQLIKMAAQMRAMAQDSASRQFGGDDGSMAYDEAGEQSFDKFFPGAARIGAI